MPSRVTLWRHKKRLKELLSRRIMTSASLFDKNLLDSTSSNISNDNTEEISHQADSLNHFESQSDFSTYNYHSDVQIAENGSQDVLNAYDEQMWLDERVENIIDPWGNVEIEPIFQYPVMEKEFLFADSSQTPTQKEIAAALVLLKIRHRISTKGINDLCKLLKLMKMPNCPINFYRVKRLLLPNASASPSSLTTYICPVCCKTVAIKPNSKKKIRVFPLVPDHQEQPRLRTSKTYDIFMNKFVKECFRNDTQLRDRLHGHISPCILRDLTYFDVGTSFLSDSLHNIYHGVVKRLLHLWLKKKYKKAQWSICSKLNVVDRYLSSIKYPSTTIRIPRSLSKYEKFKANEARGILLFGFPAFCSVLPLQYARHLLLLVVGVHIAESRQIRRTQIEDIRLLFHRFLKLFPILYTPRHNSQSVHSVHHVAASVAEYGSLSNYSTFNFENVLGLITSTVHSTRRHECEIHNNLKILRSALIEFDRSSFNNSLKRFINIAQSTKRSFLLSSINENQAVHYRQEDLNKNVLVELQHILRQKDLKLFKTCYIFTNRLSVMVYCSSSQKDDSCLSFLLAGKPSIGFIQNIIQVRRRELLLRICKVNIRDQLCLNFDRKKISCPNIFHGDIDIDNNVFIKPEAIIEKIVYTYNKQLKCYVFCRIPNLCESS
ncbi:unnamed protein product [Rotaria magnacalcarata]|uniref:Uncharacterized protein n=1 Tax=Rotaria magnacalcarata TaxID=392030 RepID=A0A8S2KY55_9BILA|nr:unnamed protein product [Rotaria magnacalcarata]CAF3886097.1 unnamed protein product [Rotaria magnacalcarata]